MALKTQSKPIIDLRHQLPVFRFKAGSKDSKGINYTGTFATYIEIIETHDKLTAYDVFKIISGGKHCIPYIDIKYENFMRFFQA